MTETGNPPHGPDTAAAYRGLILGAIAIFVILFSIVKLTSAHYDKIEASEAQQAPATK